jgi:hypothetical protein
MTNDEVTHEAALNPGQHGGVSVARLRVRPGDRVSWQFNGPFAIDFQSLTPFDDVYFHAQDNLLKQVRDDAAPGMYKYSVALMAGNGQIHLADPEMIVY